MLGFAGAEPFLKERQILLEKNSRGLLSAFEEQDIDMRCYPERHLPGAKTIISCAMGYLVAPYEPEETPLPKDVRYLGKISRYARIRDYHRVLGHKLKKIAEYISRRKYHQYQIFVDTGSLMDKAVAVRAGLGWLGENTCLFTPKYGSWVFLGEILTDIYFEPDEPMKSQCDHCGACVKACPTGALMAPFQINPHRCLSYITQLRGGIPDEFREPLGNRLFGCDTCQEACPKNRDVQVPNHPEFASKIPVEQDLWRWVHISKGDFDREYKATAASWRGRNVLRRNALCAIGNSGDKACLSRLENLLDDPSEIVRNQAQWAIERIMNRNSRHA